MDCIEFNKMIGPYLKGELSDEELNDFLHHLDHCAQCDEELEINYIVSEGMERLDRDKADYDLSRAYSESKQGSRHYMQLRKSLIRVSYVADTITLWALAMTVFVFIRLMMTGG